MRSVVVQNDQQAPARPVPVVAGADALAAFYHPFSYIGYPDDVAPLSYLEQEAA